MPFCHLNTILAILNVQNSPLNFMIIMHYIMHFNQSILFYWYLYMVFILLFVSATCFPTYNSSDPQWSFLCPRCHKSYSTRGTLTRHLSYECGVEPKFCCTVCLRKFTHKFNLQAHLLHCHQSLLNESPVLPSTSWRVV